VRAVSAAERTARANLRVHAVERSYGPERGRSIRKTKIVAEPADDPGRRIGHLSIRHAMQSPPLPLARRPVVRTSHLEEARAVYSRLSLPVVLDQAPRRRFEWDGNYAKLGPLTLSAHRFADSFTARSETVSDTYVVTIPIGHGPGDCLYGRAAVTQTPGRTGGISSGGETVTMRAGDGYRSVSVHVPSAAMQGAAAALHGRTLSRPIRFVPSIDLRAGAMTSVLRTLRYALAEADDPEGLASTTVIGDRIAELLLFRFLAAQPKQGGEAFRDACPGTPAEVRRAIEFLKANSARPIRVSEVAAAAGTSVRSLQLGFRAHRGCSPMQLLRALRLEEARIRLLTREDLRIARVAIDCGFTHFGRFSVEYRAAYGESPAATRARVMGAPAGVP
jgi:AraC-like DNA-binding protein